MPAPQDHGNVANCAPSVEGSSNSYLGNGYDQTIGIDLQKLPDYEEPNDFEDYDDQYDDDQDQDSVMHQGLKQL